MSKAARGRNFSEAYKNAQFLKWYELGKPSINSFVHRLPEDDQGYKPNITAVKQWAIEWRERAAELDAELELAILEQSTAQKIEMLERHAMIGRDVQSKALKYLDEHRDELTPASAVKLLQLGIDIERDSVGIPDALRKLDKMDDDSLLSEIGAIISNSQVTVEAIEAEITSE